MHGPDEARTSLLRFISSVFLFLAEAAPTSAFLFINICKTKGSFIHSQSYRPISVARLSRNCLFFSDTAYLLLYLSRIDSRGDSQAWKSKIIEHEFVRSRALESFLLTRAGLSFITSYKGHSSSPSDGIRTSPHH